MLAGRLVAPGRIELVDVPVPASGPGRALVRMHRAAICGSDLHAVYDGMAQVSLPAPPGFPGHEGVGEVIEADSSGLPFAPGDRVLTVPTGGSDQALGFAEYQSLPVSQLVRVPDEPETGDLLMAQQLGTVIYAMKRFWPRVRASGSEPAGGDQWVRASGSEPAGGDQWVRASGSEPGGDPARVRGADGLSAVVLGVGSAGLFFVQLLKQAGFGQILVSDTERSRLELALALGADHAVCPPDASIVDATMAHTHNAGAALVVETAGYDATRAEAVGCASSQGTLGLYGYPERFGMAPFPYYQVFRKALRIEVSVGTQLEPGLTSFAQAVDLIATGAIATDYLQSCTFALPALAQAFETARVRVHPKVQVTM